MAKYYYDRLNFNPRSPYGERPGLPRPDGVYTVISIHALRKESDRRYRRIAVRPLDFNPRSP